MSVLPAYFIVSAILLAQAAPLPSEVGTSFGQAPKPVGRDIATLTSLIPANMSALVLVPNLSKLGRQIVSTKLFGEGRNDPYHSLKASLEIVDGIDDAGAGAISIIGKAASTEMWQNMVIWLPATNPAAVMTFMQPIQISAGLYRVTIAGQASFAAEQGGFLLLSPRLEVLRTCLKSREPIKQRLSAHQQRTLGEADLALIILPDSPSFSSGGDDKKSSSWLAAWPGLAALQFLMASPTSSSHVPMWSLSIRPNGLEIAVIGYSRRNERTDKTDSALQRPSLMRGTDLLLALPSESTVAATGFEPHAAMLASSGFIDLLLNYLQHSHLANAQAVHELVRTIRQSISRASVGSIAVQSSAGSSKTFSATLILKTDADVDAAIIRAEFQSMVSQLKRGFFIDPIWQNFADRLQIMPMANSYQGVSIDHLSIDGLKAIQAEKSSARTGFISPDGVVARMAVIDDNAFVLAIGGNEQNMRDLILRWREHQTPLSSNSTIVSYASTRRFPVSAEGYISSIGLQQLAGLSVGKMNHRGHDKKTIEKSWATFSSINVELGVERFDMFLPYGWLDLMMQRNVVRN